jgi:hypothetical protein
MIIAGVTLPVLVIATGIWSPHRWGMYIDAMQEVAPISFYGQVNDVQGGPLSGVRLRVRVSKPNWAYILGAERRYSDVDYQLVTDKDGKFQITGQSGSAVRVRDITLPGYEFVPRIKNGGWDTTFYYAGAGASAGNAHKPDPNDPLTFEMRKKN